jgi:non-ribosomal peptide synthetase component F
MGSLVNTIVLRATVVGTRSFSDLVRTVADTALDGFAHQNLPFGKLVEELRPARSVSYNPVCQTVFSFGSTPSTALTHQLGDATLTFTGVSNDTVRFDFELALDEGVDGWTGRLEYAEDLWTADSAADFCSRYADLLATAVADPEAALSGLLPVIERQAQLETEPARPQPLSDAQDPELEDRLRRLWQAALETTDDIGADDDFFALGGHSLLAARLVADIRDELGRELTLTDFFMCPTLGELTALLSQSDWQDLPPDIAMIERVAAMSDEEVRARLQELVR